jgi:cytoskeleton protein RodZ
MAVCLLLTGTLALAFLPDWPRSADPRVLFRGEEVQTPSALKAVPLAPQNAQKDQNSSDSSAQALSNANSSDRSSLQPPAGEIAVSTREKVATGAAVVSTNLVSSTGTPQGHATSPLSFSVTADSWIKVTDAGGAVVLSRLVRGGESVTTGGLLPLAVVVGKADSTKVMVQGRPFDLVPHTRDNVARFEVKS